MNPYIDSILLSPRATVFEALQAMELPPKDRKPIGIVVVVNSASRLLGVITDGDIRRALLAGIGLDAPIEDIMTRDPITIRQDKVDNGSYFDVLKHIQQSRRMMDRTRGKVVVVDMFDRVVDIFSVTELLKLQLVKTQNICIVGMGYVGLTLAVAFAEAGLTVFGIETDDQIRNTLVSENLHFYEADLRRTFRSHLGKHLFIGKDPAEAHADVYIICVGTPVDGTGTPIMGHVEEATLSVASVLKRGDLVSLRSTVPIGSCRQAVLPILETESGLKAGRDFDFVFAPERTVAGRALSELRSLPQVIGSINRKGLERASSLFRELTPSVVAVDSLEEAEAVKLLNNSFRDHVFSFANEVALVCEKWNLDATRIIRAANKGYPRNPIPEASPGVGGTCLSKDPYILVASARYKGYEPRIIGRSREVNESMPYHIYDKTMSFLQKTYRRPDVARIFVVGFAFKGEPETSDMRDSTSLTLVELFLNGKVGQVLGFDPVVPEVELSRISGVEVSTVQQGFSGTDCVIIMNNHHSYINWEIHELLLSTNRPSYFIDCWRLFEPSDICKLAGITYGALGIDYVGSNEGDTIFPVS